MTDNEKLIEEARALVARQADAAPKSVRELILAGDVEDDRTRILVQLTRALEAAERALTPTDDEREAQGWSEAALYAEDAESQDDFMSGWRTADRLRRTEVPEPSAEDDLNAEYDARLGDGDRDDPEPSDLSICECYRDGSEMVTCPRHTKPQGEPSDAQVQVAFDIIRKHRGGTGLMAVVRDALRAAGGVR